MSQNKEMKYFKGKMKESSSVNVLLGTDFFGWIRVLVKIRFYVALNKIPLAVLITVTSFFNTLLFWIEWAVFGFWVSKIKINEPPVFILGHWRSGTTLIHELIGLDRRHVYPTNWDCFVANHFLLTGWFLKPLLKRLLPDKRPQDNMPVEFDLPQEDECALSCLGAPSAYMHFFFPKNRQAYYSLHDIEKQSKSDQKRWQRIYLWFLKRVIYTRPGRLISKSPTHAFRIKTLLRLFPEARFVNIIRNPYHVVNSTLNLYKSVSASYNIGPLAEKRS